MKKGKMKILLLVLAMALSAFASGLTQSDPIPGNDGGGYDSDEIFYFNADGSEADGETNYWVSFEVDGQYLSFTSNNVIITSVTVKGGNAHYIYTNLGSSESGMHAPLVGNVEQNGGNIPDISHYNFTFEIDDVPPPPPLLGQIEIEKYVIDEDEDPIDDENEFEFKIEMKVENQWVEIDESPVLVEAGDSIVIPDLPLGEYRVTEEDKEGYTLHHSDNDTPVLSEEDRSETVEFTNMKDEDTPPPPPWEGTIRIQKLIPNEPNESLEGFEFELWKDGVKVRGPESTDEYGQIDFTDLPAGEYEIRELESDFIADYLDDNPIEIGPEIENDNDNVWVVRVNNTRIEIDDIVIQKIVTNDDDLSGFIFRLYRIVDDEEEFVAERTTSVTGRIAFEDQPDGEYVLYEVGRPGYAMGIGAPGSDDGEEFFHSENMTYPIEVTNRKLPTPELGEIEVTKIVQNSSGSTMTSNNTRFYFELQMLGEGWMTIDSGFIDGNGTLVFEDLEDGEYRIREVNIDDDFNLISPNNILVEIEDGSFEDVEFVNRLRTLPPDEDDDDDDRPRPRPEPEDEPEDEPEVLEVTVVEPIPEATPTPEPEPVVEIVEEPVPLATLPATGASDPTLLGGFGAALLGFGMLLKKKND